jgi:hypothetical protein
MKSDKEYCSLHREKYFHYTCYDETILDDLLKENNKNPLDYKTIKDKHDELRKLFSECEYEYCMTKDKPHLHNKYFKPVGQKKNTDWLSNVDIDDVLDGYRYIFYDYINLETIPVDYLTKYQDFNVNKRYSIVINQSLSSETGSHWVCIFLDFPNKSIEYFDSTGESPMKEYSGSFKKNMKFIQDFLNKMSKEYDLKLKINKQQHQYGNNDCGVYCLWYITERLKGKSLEELSKRKVKDKEMNKYREIFFVPYE